MTSKKDLTRAYDALANAINTYVATKATLHGYAEDRRDGILQDAVDALKARGRHLLDLKAKASGRCGDMVELSNSLLDRSTSLIIAHTEQE